MTQPKTASAQTESELTDITGLYASAPAPLGFAPGLDARAFGLRRDAGSLLIYSVPSLDPGSPMLDALGPISRQYLSHRHEAGFLSDRVGPPLFVHESERDSVAENHPVEQAFTGRQMLAEDFEAIPIPGHTSGATAYLWKTAENRLLFTGDTVYLADGEWGVAMLAQSDRDSYIESLELIRELDFNVIVPWIASGLPFYQRTDAADIRRRIDPLIAGLRGGGSG